MFLNWGWSHHINWNISYTVSDSHATTSLDIPTTEVVTPVSLTEASPTGSQITAPQDQIGENNESEFNFFNSSMMQGPTFLASQV